MVYVCPVAGYSGTYTLLRARAGGGGARSQVSARAPPMLSGRHCVPGPGPVSGLKLVEQKPGGLGQSWFRSPEGWSKRDWRVCPVRARVRSVLVLAHKSVF